MVTWNPLTWWLIPAQLLGWVFVALFPWSGVIQLMGVGIGLILSSAIVWATLSYVYCETDHRDGYGPTLGWTLAVMCFPPALLLWHFIYIEPEHRAAEQRRAADAAMERILASRMARLEAGMDSGDLPDLAPLPSPRAAPGPATRRHLSRKQALEIAHTTQIYEGAVVPRSMKADPTRGQHALSPAMVSYREQERRALLESPLLPGKLPQGRGAKYVPPIERGIDEILRETGHLGQS